MKAEQENILDIEDIKSQFNNKFGSIADIKLLLEKYLERKNIDLISRIRDVELDKICNLLHHSHLISIKMNIAILGSKKFSEVLEKDIKLSSGELYGIRNLSLRLSLDSSSRKEIENILVSLIKKEMERKEYSQNQNETKPN